MVVKSINVGDLVKVAGFEEAFKVISMTQLEEIQKLELLSLKNNQIRTFLSPPLIIKPLLSPLGLVLAGEFGSPSRFNLFVEAIRLSYMHLYDPLLSLSSTKIDVLPHQVEAVDRMLKTYWPTYLLADDAGLGKTIMAGMLIKELELRKRIERVLIVVPAALKYQWRRELLNHFGEKFILMDAGRLYTCYEDQPEMNPWQLYHRVITSMDFAKRKGILDQLREAQWDLVIIDEAHKMTAHRSGAKTRRTRRFNLGEVLQETSNSLLFLTATPHSGESYAFYRLLSLLDPYLSTSGGYQIPRDKLKRIMIRRIKEDVKTLDGKPLFPEREAKTLIVNYSKNETSLYQNVINYVTHYFNLATTAKNRGVSFAMMILQKRMASSIEAIRKSLERRLERLQKLRTLGELLTDTSSAIPVMEDEEITIDDLEDKDKEELEGKYELLTMAKNLEELDREIGVLEDLISEAHLVTRDSKAEKLIEFVRRIHNKDPSEKILIFTEYRDTLDYLVERLQPLIRKWKAKIAIIHGGIKPEDRPAQEDKFKQPNVPVMVATDAAGEGINLQFAHLMVNYELPWNPNRLEQRIGRLHRYKQKKKVFVYNMLVQSTIEGNIFQRLLDKIETIKTEMGERVFDVLGLLLSDIRIEELVMEAVGKDSEWIRVKMSEVEARIDASKRMILEEIENKLLIKDRLDMGTVKRLLDRSNESRLIHSEIERFIRLFLAVHGGKLEANQEKEGTFKITPPKILKRDSQIYESLYVFGTRRTPVGWQPFERCQPIAFSKEISEKYDGVRFVALGHSLLSRMIRICTQPDFGGKVTIKQHPTGIGGALFVFRSRVINLRSNIRGERLISIMWDSKENHFKEVDPAAFWALEDKGKKGPAKRFLDSLGTFKKVHAKAESLAAKLTEFLLQDTDKKVKKETAIKIEDIKNYRSMAMTRLKDSITREERQAKALGFFHDEADQKRLKQRIGRRKAAIKRLTEKTEAELKMLEAESKLVPEAPECLAIAILVPKPARTQFDSEDSSATQKTKVEKAGIKRVIKSEREKGREPIDVSPMFKGYDIVSEGKSEKRFIEVKSFKNTGPLQLTTHEWIVSQRLGKDYWLYIVENALSPHDSKITEVCDPFAAFSNTAQEIPILEFKILIENWKNILKSTSKKKKAVHVSS